MVANQTESTRLEQRLIIKFLVAGKNKPCEIYRRMCDVCKEACFNKKNFYKLAKCGFAIMILNQKTVYRIEIHWLSDKEKVPDTAVCKEDADSLMQYEKIHHYWFSWKRCNFATY